MLIKVKNYKCFGNDEQGFSEILPLNIIIGKNNSGKSTLIELIDILMRVEQSNVNDSSSFPTIVVEDIITEPGIRQAFPDGVTGGDIPNSMTHYKFGLQWVGTRIKYSIGKGAVKRTISFEKPFLVGRSNSQNIVNGINRPFWGKKFLRISSERDILPEPENAAPTLTSKGAGATNYVQQFINYSQLDSKLVERKLLDKLNVIVGPELRFKDILVQRNPDGRWEIFLEDEREQRMPLSGMGSGLKTILLVLIILYLVPAYENKKPNQYVFAFEELENNLHPSMQRKLLSFIAQYSKDEDSTFFLTTHSNVVIDLVANNSNAQILHIVNNDGISVVNEEMTYSKNRAILDDLDVRASDILQSNCIIWVEGPSDRVYLNKWITLVDDQLKEGVHYIIMFYGGRLLKNVHALPEFIDQELIPLLKINRNAFVIIDRDAKTVSSRLNDTKQRIAKEIGDDLVWITKGREIENYLSKELIITWLKAQHTLGQDLGFEQYDKLEESLKSISKIDYAQNKNIYAGEIVRYMTTGHLNILDLESNLKKLTTQIRLWNKLLI